MWRLLYILTCAALLHHGVAQLDIFPRDCRLYADADACSNDGSGTNLGTCSFADDTTAGACTCDTGDYFDCSIARVANYAATCTANSASCIEANTYDCDGTTCNCKEKYTTDAAISAVGCNTERVRAVCGSAGADMAIYPHTGFSGAIYFKSSDDANYIPECEFTADGTKYKYDGYSYTAPGSSDALCPTAAETAGTPNTYKWIVYLQQNANFRSAADLKISITCDQLADGEEELATVNVANAAPNAKDVTQTASASSGISLTLHPTGTTDPLPPEVAAGAKIDFVIEGNTLIVPEFTAKSIEISNHPFLDTPPGSAASFFLINHGCIPASSAGLVTGMTKAKDGDIGKIVITVKGFQFKIQADGYKFDSSPAVPVGTSYVQAIIYAGTYTRPDSATDCKGVTTDGPFVAPTGYTDIVATTFARRRKRSTDEEPRDVYLNVTMVIADPFGVSPSYQPGSEVNRGDSTSCYNSAAFIVPLVLMSLLVVVAAAMAFFFCNRLTRYQDNRMDGTSNMAYKS